MLTLDKRTGRVTCDLPGLATLAQEHLDRAIEARTRSDVTRVIQKLFERHADLFAIRPQGGCYFVPARHGNFVDKVSFAQAKSPLNGGVIGASEKVAGFMGRWDDGMHFRSRGHNR